MSGKDAAKALVEKWLQENGFNEEGYTYIYFPKNSYDVKDELKAAGFKWHQIMLWHSASDAGYEDKVVKIHKDEIMEFTVFGQPFLFESATKLIKEQVRAARPASTSEWIGEEKEKLVELPVVLHKRTGFQGQFGWTNVYTFLYDDKDIVTWFTSKDIEFAEGDSVYLSATIKERSMYNDEKQTLITRARVTGIKGA